MSLNLLIGPMFSSKTTELIRQYNIHKAVGRKCLVIKYAADIRYSKLNVSSHDQWQLNAISANLLADVDIQDYDVILVDEVQFFPDAAKYCELWANNKKIVYAVGLSGTYQRKPFAVISELLPLADNIMHLTAVCKKTKQPAAFTKIKNIPPNINTDNGKQESQDIIIGGAELYEAVDRNTYFNE